MKKLLALLLALVMALSMVACGGEDEEEETRSKKKKSDKETSEETSAEVSEETTEPEEEEVDRREDYESPYTEFETMDDVVIVDDEYAKITLSELKSDDWSVGYEATVENKYDGLLSCATNEVAINGKVGYSGMYVSAEEDETVTEECLLYDVEDPDDVTRITMSLMLYDSESYDTIAEYLIDIYPQGKDAYEPWDAASKREEVLYDQDGIMLTVTDYELDDYGSYCVHYQLCNYTEEVISVQVEALTVNGLSAKCYSYPTALPDTYNDTYLAFDMNDLEVLGLDEVTSIELLYDVVDADYYSIAEDTVMLYPEGKGEAEVFEYSYDSDDLTVAEGDDFKLSLVEVQEDDGNCTLFFFLENSTSGSMYVDGGNVKLNGKALEYSYFYISACPGADSYGTYTVYSFELEEMDIDELETVEIELEVYNEDYDELFKDAVEIEID